MKKYPLPIIGLLIISLVLIFGITKFAVDSLTPTGNAILSTKVNIFEAQPANCSFEIPSGISQVSFFCIPNGIVIDDVLENTTYTSLWTYEHDEPADPWKSYNPSLPSWVVHDLTLMTRTNGYYIKTSSNQTYFFAGSKRIPNEISLTSGWNFVGYPTNETIIIPNAFLSLDGTYEEVRSYNNSDSTYYVHTPPSNGNLIRTEPYRTYWIYVNASSIWEVSS